METTPTYNLNVVVRETGIKPDALRAWERRYGLPEPSRTAGGHRLYSERDIAIVQWLVDRQAEGLRISHAVDLWNQMVADGQEPLLVKPIEPPSIQSEILHMDGTPAINELKTRWVNACMRYDEGTAENIANFAFALYPVETVCFEILLAGLAEIGDSWYQAGASVQQEHFASSIVVQRLNTLIAATPKPTRTAKILISCPPNEQHTIPLLMISLMLRQRGWGVVNLGANVPISRFKETVDSVKPHLSVLTAHQLPSAASLLELANYLSQINVPTAYGGLIFSANPNIQKIIPGNFLGNHLKNAADTIEDLVVSPPPIPEVFRKREDYQSDLENFIKQRSAIEVGVAKQINQANAAINDLETANHFLARSIEAMIILGIPNSLMNEITWINKLISNKEISMFDLHEYLSGYYRNAKRLLGNDNQIVIEALEMVVNRKGEEP